MLRLSKFQIGRGAAFLYIENLISMAYGYAFWYILSRITTPDVIGVSSSLISLVTIMVSIASIGIPVGSQRFLGKIFLEGRFEDAKVVVESSLVVVTFGIILCSIVLLIAREWLFGAYQTNLIILALILVAGTTINILLRYIIIASLDTKKILVITIIASGVKLLLTIILVSQIEAESSVIIGFSIAPILSAILFAFSIRSIFKKTQNNSSFKFIGTLRIILSASVVAWIPSLMDTIGSQIGNVMMLGIQGANQAGIYFIAFQIVIGISAIIWALESVAYPILSAMNQGRRLVLWRIIKIGLVIVLPLSVSLIFYSRDIMQIFGQNYTEGSLPLQLLLISVFPTAISAGISILMFAYGNYRDVLVIGLASSIPRIVFYFIFIPSYSGTGAALSFTLGSIIGLVVSLIIGKRFDIILVWKDLVLICCIPLVFAFGLSTFNFHFIPAILISIILSYIVLLRYKIVTREDVQDSMSILPSNIAIPIINTVNKIGSKLNKNY